MGAFDVGDWVAVVYWQPFPLSGSPNNGTWEVAGGRVISVGKGRLAFEASNPSLMSDTATPGSPVRFADLDKVFTGHEEAAAAASQLPPPQTGAQ